MPDAALFIVLVGLPGQKQEKNSSEKIEVEITVHLTRQRGRTLKLIDNGIGHKQGIIQVGFSCWIINPNDSILGEMYYWNDGEGYFTIVDMTLSNPANEKKVCHTLVNYDKLLLM